MFPGRSSIPSAGSMFRNFQKQTLAVLFRRVEKLCRGAKYRVNRFVKQPFGGKGVLVWRVLGCYTFRHQPIIAKRISFERSMPRPSPSRSRRRHQTGFRLRVTPRWRLGNSSTKVLFGHPASPSTFIPHAAAPASLVISTGGQLFLRARNL